jgi:hypothetical protein
MIGCRAAAVAAAAPAPVAALPPAAAAAAAASAAAAVVPVAALLLLPGVMRTASCICSRDWRMSGEPVPSPEGPDLLMLMAGRLRDSSALLLTPSKPDELARANPP